MYFPCVTSFHNGFTLLVSCASTICWLEGTQEASYLGWPIRTLQCPKYCISVCKSCNTMQIIHHCGTSGGPFSASRCLFRKGLYLQHQSKNRSSVSLLEVEEVSHLGGMGVSQRWKEGGRKLRFFWFFAVLVLTQPSASSPPLSALAPELHGSRYPVASADPQENQYLACLSLSSASWREDVSMQRWTQNLLPTQMTQVGHSNFGTGSWGVFHPVRGSQLC